MAVAGVCEVNGTLEISYTVNGGLTARRSMKCPWESWQAYATQLAPLTVVIGTAVVQKPPEPLPYLTALRVAGFRVAPFYGEKDRVTNPEEVTDDTSLSEFEFARFDIDYAIPTSPQTDDEALERGDPVPFLEHRVTSGGQLIDVYDNVWIWKTSTAVLDTDAQRVPVMVATTQHSVFWPRVIQPHYDNLENFHGHVNETAFKLRGHEYPAETLMYMNYDETEVLQSDGTSAVNLTLHFEGKRVKNQDFAGGYDEFGGHNHFYNKDTGKWDKIVRPTDADHSPHPKADFNDLFKASA